MPGLRRILGVPAGVLLVLLVFAAMAPHASLPSPRLIDIGSPGDAYVQRNFYAPESAAGTTYRWSGPFSSLQLPQLPTNRLVLTLRLRGGLSNSPLYLRAAGQQQALTALPTGDTWRVYHVLLSHPLTPLLGAAPGLDLIGELVRPLPHDSRSLGVALDWVRFVPLVTTPGIWPATLLQAALFAWALLLIGAVIRLGYATVNPGGATGHAALVSVAPPALLALFLISWAWHDGYSLQWLLPLRPLPLFVASLTLLGGWGLLRWRDSLAIRREQLPALVVVGSAIAAHSALLLPLDSLWRGIAALFLLWLPGALLARLLFRHTGDRVAQVLLGLCGAVTLHILLMLIFAALPGPISALNVLLVCDLLSLVAGVWLLRSPASPRQAAQPWRIDWLPGVIVLLAALLRLPLLGSAEVHDDEASVLIAATQLVAGRYEPLMTQLKGPAQIVLPAGILALTGQLPEAAARLPFALAGIGVVLGGFVLARELFGSTGAALVSAALLALDGFLIGFSRIVQYQSIVLLLSIGALWWAARFASGAPGTRHGLVWAALLYAVALLGHHDAIFVAPAFGWLILVGARKHNWRGRDWPAGLALAVGVGGGVLASFYIPFALHPHFAKTVAHLGERTGQEGGATLFNNLADTATLAGFYQSPLQQSLVALLLCIAAVAALLRYVQPRPVAWLAGLWLVIVGAILIWNPAAFGAFTTLGLLALPLGILLTAPAMPAGERAIWFWAGGAWLAMIFLIAQPRTHIYVAAIPTALILGAGVAYGIRRFRARYRQNAAASVALIIGLLFLATTGIYQASLFLRQAPEYVRDYPATLLYGRAAEPINPNARFGFPVRDGWKAIAELYRTGILDGAFVSNQSSEIIAWYTGGMRRCGAEPTYALIALSEPNPAIPPDAALFGMVQVAGQNRIAIYRWGAAAAAPRIFALEAFIAAADARPIPTIPPPEVTCGT